MMSLSRSITAIIAVAGLTTACAASDEERVDLTDNPLTDKRVVEEVNQLCFARTINGFRNWDAGEGVILRQGVNNEFLVTFQGVCQPLDNAQRVGVNNRFGSGCIRQGDRLFISEAVFSGRNAPFESDFCVVRDVFAFDRSQPSPLDEEDRADEDQPADDS